MKLSRKCRVIATGEEFNSIKEMAEAKGWSIHKVHHILKGTSRDSLGIEYVGESLIGKVITEAVCKKCNVLKPAADFGIDKRTNSIRGYVCKRCRADRENNRRVELGPQEMRIRTITSKYKVSRDKAIELMAVENCGCCGIELISASNNPKKGTANNQRVIDHNHTTGEVRGVLCSNCNIALGHSKDDIESLKRMINYLESHK